MSAKGPDSSLMDEPPEDLDKPLVKLQDGVRGVAIQTLRVASSTARSRGLQKLVGGTIFVAVIAALIYVPIALSYIFVYYKYLPDLVTTVPVHLQYGVGPNPFGITSLGRLVHNQAYDISVSLTLPRSPTNLDRGNFMVALHLLSESTASSTSNSRSPPPLPYLTPDRPFLSSDSTTPPINAPDSALLNLRPTRLNLPSYLASRTIVLTTTRSALIPYTDPLVSLAKRLLFLPYHMLFPHRSTSVHLTVPMAEKAVFSLPRRGQEQGDNAVANLPGSLLLEVQAGQGIQVYEASVTLVARLRGVRWIMWRWRMACFWVVTGVVWVGVVAGLFSVGVLRIGLETVGGGEGQEKKGKRKGNGAGNGDESGSDSDEDGDDDGGEEEKKRTVKREHSLPRVKAAAVKKEEEEEGSEPLFTIPQYGEGPGGKADDEDEGQGEEEGSPQRQQGGSKDAGVGTSSGRANVVPGARRRNISSRRASR
ncbi:hypothetical protein VTI74DRAFT_1840 [Chaetomium olivicolor]